MLDIDHFKVINDTLGHQAGDFVLKQLADFLKKSIRPYDLLARYGGEEFIMLYKDCTRKEAGEILNRIRDAVEARTLPVPGTKQSASPSAAVSRTSPR